MQEIVGATVVRDINFQQNVAESQTVYLNRRD